MSFEDAKRTLWKVQLPPGQGGQLGTLANMVVFLKPLGATFRERHHPAGDKGVVKEII